MAGTWNATSITDTIGGNTRNCADKSFTITRVAGATSSEYTVTIGERSFSCANASYTTTYSQIAFNEVDGKLYRTGRHVGEISSTNLEFDIKLSDTKTWSFALTPSGDTTAYTESVTGSSTTSATLSR